MHCPKCGHPESKVLETRAGKDNRSLRRRRECQQCECRFTTVEEIQREELVVVKKNDRRQEFSREKIARGIRAALVKRPFDLEAIDALVSEVVDAIQRRYDGEVSSEAIGEEVMARLKAVDHVGYVRFACVYRDFDNIDDIASTIKDLKKRKK